MIDRETSLAPSTLAAEERLLLDYGVDTAKIMVHRVAHDFNNLIAVVRGYASVLQGRPGLNEDCRELVGLIEQAGSELASLTERMGQFANNNEHEFSWFNLNSVILEFLEECRDQAPQGIEMEIDLGISIPDLWGNTRLIGELCQRLWSNAIDSMPDGGPVTCKTGLQHFGDVENPETAAMHHSDVVEDRLKANRANGQDKSGATSNGPATYLLLQVADTGEGMDEETHANMLRPFFSTKAGKVRGLGATVVYETVKLHGGRLYSPKSAREPASIYISRWLRKWRLNHLARVGKPRLNPTAKATRLIQLRTLLFWLWMTMIWSE